MISNIYHIFEYTIFWKLFVDDTYKLFKSYLKKNKPLISILIYLEVMQVTGEIECFPIFISVEKKKML